MTKSELLKELERFADDAVIFVNVEGGDYRWNGDKEYSEFVTTIEIEEATSVEAHARWLSEPNKIDVLIK